MRNGILKRSVALILALILSFSVCLSLLSCDSSKKDDESNDTATSTPETNNNNSNNNNQSSDTREDYHDKIVVPEYKDFGRDTIDFKNISYSRPDYESIINGFKDIITIIEENNIEFEEQVARIVDMEDEYGEIQTMYTLSNIYNSKDSSSLFWNEEYAYSTSNYPLFAQVIEDMFVAAANSPHAERFEDEYFGEGLIKEYKDGGKFTDRMIELWAKEGELEAEYSSLSLSTATVTVTYMGMTDTIDAILEFYEETYGGTSGAYVEAYTICMSEYKKIYKSTLTEIFIELVKTRKQIANELGHSSYAEFGYETLGRDYSPKDISGFLDDIASYIVPTYRTLSYSAFQPYFKSNYPKELSLDKLINNTGSAIAGVDENLSLIYHYMLQHGLYDIEILEQNRQEGAFTAYLESYNAPFIFMSASENITDYSTLIHEFGHFADAYLNYNSETSIDQKEISSQGLEYLMLLYLDGILSEKDVKYLTYYQMKNAMETLIFQGFYAKLEELIYALPLSKINEENINKQVIKAANAFELNTELVNDISVAFIPHIFIYPFYVQSYCVSIVPALQLYFMEAEKKGSGFDAYRMIVDRNNEDHLTFEQTLEDAGLTSPFDDGVLMEVADDIYYYFIGTRKYNNNSSPDNINAA